MSDPFIAKLNEKHLCTWYILPWIDLNPKAFGTANFINSYIVRDSRIIAVRVADSNLCRNMMKHDSFQEKREREDGELLLYWIPDEWAEDFGLFLQGRYSKFSQRAKRKIIQNSGLGYEVPDTKGNKRTDAILMALDRHPVLAEKWLEILGSDAQLPEELLSAPSPESFIILQG